MDIEEINITNQIIELEYLDNIPIAFCRPDKYKSNNSIAVWLPYLGGSKESVKRELQMLSSYGYFAISIDLYLNGERVKNLKEDIRTLVFENFRAYMWEMLGITAMDIYRTIDWAIKTFKLNDYVVIGGLSMGGDIALAVAGMDVRIKKVSAIGASPNWDRHGMTDVMDSKKIIEQGQPTNFGKWLYNKLNPVSNLELFCRPMQIHLEFGELDTHIHSEWTVDFKNKLIEKYPEEKCNIELIINNGLDHLSLLQSESVIEKAIFFLQKE